MKATLTIGTSRLTTDLSPERLNTVLETFIKQIGGQVSESGDDGGADQDEDGVLSDSEAEQLFDLEYDNNAVPEPNPLTPLPSAPVPALSGKASLFVFQCPNCRRRATIKRPRDFGKTAGESFNCNCGSEIEVVSVMQASGECPNCGAAFWNMGMLNGLTEINCRECRSPIDLFVQGNGKLGNSLPSGKG